MKQSLFNSFVINRILCICANQSVLTLFPYRCKTFKRHAIRPVADGMERDLKSRLVAFKDHAREFFGRAAGDAAVFRIVREGREHGGGARSQCAVNVAFERRQADAQRIDFE
jgi:hypothetical protein